MSWPGTLRLVKGRGFLCHISSDDRISVGCETVCLRGEEGCSVGQVSQPDPRYALGFVGLFFI